MGKGEKPPTPGLKEDCVEEVIGAETEELIGAFRCVQLEYNMSTEKLLLDTHSQDFPHKKKPVAYLNATGRGF